MLPANRTSKGDTYWFASEDPVDVVRRLRPDDRSSAYTNNPMAAAWSRNLYTYYSNVVRPQNWDTGLNFTGTQGELVEMLVPMARSLTRQLVSIVTKQKLAFSVIADNTKSEVIQTARLGNSLVKHIVKKQELDTVYENMFEHSLLTGLGFLYAQWRTDKGEYYAQDMQGVDHFKGDLEISAPSVWDMDFDAMIPDPRDWQWVQVRKIHNRWDLIAQFPDLQRELAMVPSIKEVNGGLINGNQYSPSDDDNIYVYTAYHKPSPTLPDGRMVAYASEKAILFDGVNIYGELPVYVCRAEPMPGTSYGYPYFSNLIQAQEMLDNTLSTIATNTSTFGVQSVSAARGSNIDVVQIQGMSYHLYTPTDGSNGGRPEPMQLTAVAADSWKFLEVLKSLLLDISMINSALRGDPPTGVTSGAAIATLTTTALESVASSSKAARLCLRKCMLGSINAYKRMASVEREMDIGGIGNQAYSKKFKGSDLDGIKDVDIAELNPLMHTMMGRKSEAQELMKTGLITNIKGYFSVIEGAPVSELYENELSQEDLVKRENEAMLTGEQVIVVNIDSHAYHIMMHAMLLNDPKVRLNQAMSQGVLAHILKHYEEASGQDPMFAAMVATGKLPEGGFQPPQLPAPPPSAMPPPGSEGGKPSQPANPAKDMLQRGVA